MSLALPRHIGLIHVTGMSVLKVKFIQEQTRQKRKRGEQALYSKILSKMFELVL